MRRCIVNYFSKGRENYAKGSERLANSLYQSGYIGDFIAFSPDAEIETYNEVDVKVEGEFRGYGSLIKSVPFCNTYGQGLTHKEAPYQFKSYAIQYAREKGYDQVAWMDSSTVIFKPLDCLFNLSKQIGVVLFDNPGCPEATWTSDDCLEIMECGIETARSFFQIDAAVMFFDFTKSKANRVFDEYIEVCRIPAALKGESGSQRDDFKAHRHDQSVMSFIARIKNHVLPLNYGVWCYGSEINSPSNEFEPTWAKVGMA